jgi:predicted Zn-dependent protease with MMP-like domain
MEPMSLRRFGQIVREVMETLPEEFYPYLENVVVDVEEEPDEKTLRDAGFTPEEIAEGATLLGLFEPMPLPSPWSGEAVHVRDMQRRLRIFKRPHEEAFTDPKVLLDEIRKTVIHELGHHFGLDERDVRRLGL